MKLLNALTDPAERHRVELYRHADGSFTYRVLTCQKKRWRAWSQDSPLRFSSYAAAFSTAAMKHVWLANAVGAASKDWRHAYHLELSRGLIFRFAKFSATVFGDDHFHCSACSAKFADFETGGILDEGYVTKYVIPDGSSRWQWNWVCAPCFHDFQASLDWGLEFPHGA